MKLPWLKPAPLPAPNHEAELSHDVHANIVSKWLFSWSFPILRIGYGRPLEAGDLWKLDEPRLSTTTGTALEKNFYDRVPPSSRPRFLRPKDYKPPRSSATPDDLDDPEKKEKATSLPEPATASKKEKKRKTKEEKKLTGNNEGGKVRGEDGKVYDQSMIWALQETFRWDFWLSAVFFVFSALLQTTSPLVTKKLLNYITVSYVYSKAPEAERAALPVPKSIGYGVGVSFALFVMQEASSLFQNQYMQRGQCLGFQMRSSLIANISRKSLRLSGASRVKHSNGNLITLVASDTSFMDWASFLVHALWVYPIQICIGIALLIVNLGYSALVGVAILILNTPIQGFFVKTMFRTRQSQLKIVDQRVRLLSEVLNGIRVVKLYAYEAFFKGRILELRGEEMKKLKTIARTRAGMSATMSFVPVAAAVLSFITYSLSGHNLNAATIFSSLQLFNVIRQPLMMLPMAFTVCSDAAVALQRITKAMLAEELVDDLQVDPTAPDAIRAYGKFCWETSSPGGGVMGQGGGRGGRDYAAEKAKKVEAAKKKKEAKERKKKGLSALDGLPTLEKNKQEKPPFELTGIDVRIPRGSLVCIVGSVGSGKSSLLQAFIGEMRKLEGDVVFGGPVAYASQAPWVQNANLRDNILFGKEFDHDRFEDVIHACCLESDIGVLPSGLETEIGEKGINLSGGQKARVCLARTVYFGADVVLLDDPLSAVDAHVSKHILNECLLDGPLVGKTRVLVTHHLDVLPHADHIILMDGGRIVEQGTYADLLHTGAAFSKLIAEYGSTTAIKSKGDGDEDEDEDAAAGPAIRAVREKKVRAPAAPGAALMQEEDRATGAISGKVYKHYAQSMGSVWWAPILFGFYAMAQVATVGNNIFLGFWSAQSITGFSQGEYMAIYASFGLASGIFTFIGTFLLYLRGITASYHLFNEALVGVMRSRISFFDTTPIGRIVNRLSKDITTLDNQLPMQWNQLLSLVFSVFGTVGLVFYTFPLLGIIFAPMLVLYYLFADFYRRTSREVKRLDSNLRSHVYTSYGEMLGGMASVRAYQQQQVFTRKTEDAIDYQNRANFMTITLQRWLGIRLDFLGNILILGVGLFGVGFRHSVSPSKLGVVLTYSLSVTQVFSQLVSIFATVEQDMNTAERVSHYSKLDPEGLVETANDPPKSWPEQGVIEFKDVRMRYREGLPEILKGVSFKTSPGEKIGIVGRTGAGKSSIVQALFRIVDISGGSIEIDGRDIAEIGLDSLRHGLAVVPQDALLYAGTVRQNLDPTGDIDDATLNMALQKAGLVAPFDASEDVKERFSKFKLDAQVNDEGSNFSGGERQLVALSRALVKNAKVIVLDESTSSVDAETDQTVQRAIQSEFANSSLLSIAHRLATIAFYDRVIVMDQGQVAEFDTPLSLFDQADSIFRGMCDKAHLSRDDIVKIRRGAGKDLLPVEAVALDSSFALGDD